MTTSSKYAVITGASRGLGRCFAIELSKKGMNTILVGMPGENLKELSEELIERYRVSSVFFETDLTVKDNVLQFTDWANDQYNIHVLINNAGVGGTRQFIDADVNYIDNIIQLNVMATTLITRQLLPNLMKQTEAYILNVSSMAAFSPIGYKTVYPASKVFIHYFSRSLNAELANTNVFVSVVNPGPMKTNADVTQRINRQGILGRLGLLSPEKVAEISVRRLFKKDSMIMLNLTNGISWLLMKIVPVWIRLPILTKAVKRELNLG